MTCLDFNSSLSSGAVPPSLWGHIPTQGIDLILFLCVVQRRGVSTDMLPLCVYKSSFKRLLNVTLGENVVTLL